MKILLPIILFFPSVQFHIAHLYEVQKKHKLAKELYEQLLKEKDLPQHLKADIYRQLGKLVISSGIVYRYTFTF